MSRPDDELPAIDVADLDGVTGGAATNEQITEAIQGIQKTLDGMKSSNQNTTNWFVQMLPFFLFGPRGLNGLHSASCGCGCKTRGGCGG
ncbi:MAG TPA: hypothetical protein VIV11_36790 [Kofleriaceae bacterium]